MTDQASAIISDLAWLHHVVSLNRVDADAAAAEHPIDYFIDTNVWRFALDPSRADWEHRSPVAVFEQNVRHQDMALHPAAYEVAEYLFSRKLPGQRGQLLVSAPHAIEIDRNVASITEDAPAPSTKEVRALLATYSDEVLTAAAGGFTADEILSLAENASDLVAQMFEGALQQVLGLKRLARFWRPATGVAEYGDVVRARSTAQTREWCIRLACAYDSARFQSVAQDLERWMRQSVRRQLTIENDARTILDVIELGRRSPATKTVFLTSSRGIHRAYREWFLDQYPSAPPADYVLRHPLQYIPLINIFSYARVFGVDAIRPDEARIFKDIETSLDAFLDPLTARPRFRRVLEILRTIESPTRHVAREIAALTAQLEWQDSDDDATYFVKNWRLAYANAALMVIPAIRSRQEQHRQILKDAIEKAGGDHLLAQQTIVANIEADHISAALWSIGQEAAREHERLPEALRKQDDVRVVLPVLIPLSDSEGELSGTIVAALGGSVREAANVVRQFASGDAAQELSPPRLLAAACLSLALGEWDLAKRLGARWSDPGRAGHLLDSQGADYIGEFQYLHALATRFECRSIHEYHRAEEELRPSDAPTTHEGRALRNARGLIERGTLRSSAALWLVSRGLFDKPRLWPDFKPPADFKEANLLRQAEGDFASARDRMAGIRSDLAPNRRLRRQAAVNILCCYNLACFAGQDSSSLEELATWAYTLLTETVSETPLKWISWLTIEAYQYIAGFAPAFPGAESEKYYELYSDIEKLDEYPITRSFIAPSDKHLLRLYQQRLSVPTPAEA